MIGNMVHTASGNRSRISVRVSPSTYMSSTSGTDTRKKYVARVAALPAGALAAGALPAALPAALRARAIV